jgi:hypothetical protein
MIIGKKHEIASGLPKVKDYCYLYASYWNSKELSSKSPLAFD